MLIVDNSKLDKLENYGFEKLDNDCHGFKYVWKRKLKRSDTYYELRVTKNNRLEFYSEQGYDARHLRIYEKMQDKLYDLITDKIVYKLSDKGIDRVYTIDEIKSLTFNIFKKYEIDKAYLFGSYARGTARVDSNIDIMVSGGKRRPFCSGGLHYDLENILKLDVNLDEEEYKDNIFPLQEIVYSEIKKDLVLIYDKDNQN